MSHILNCHSVANVCSYSNSSSISRVASWFIMHQKPMLSGNTCAWYLPLKMESHLFLQSPHNSALFHIWVSRKNDLHLVLFIFALLICTFIFCNLISAPNSFSEGVWQLVHITIDLHDSHFNGHLSVPGAGRQHLFIERISFLVFCDTALIFLLLYWLRLPILFCWFFPLLNDL